MIREADESDIPAILGMGARFFEAAQINGVEYQADSVEQTLRHLLASPDGILLVLDENGVKGMLGALLFPVYFNLSHKAGQELFWWVNPESRGSGLKLLEAAEQQAKDLGAITFSMIHLHNLMPDALKRVYTSRGYAPSETHYMKVL